MGTLASMFANLKCIFEYNSFERANSCSQYAQFPARDFRLYKDTWGFRGQGSSCQQWQPGGDGAAKCFCATFAPLSVYAHTYRVTCKAMWEKTCP